MTIIYAILMFAVLIIVHEWGHFIAAKACGVKVEEFSVGMGPAIYQKQKGETLYSVRAIPIGGYCKMEGENGPKKEDDNIEKNDQPADDPLALYSGKPLVTNIEDTSNDNSEEKNVVEEHSKTAFNNKKPWQKIIILFAGAFMNLVVGVLLVSIVLFAMGTPVPKIETVVDNTPAAEAGLMAGDEFVAVNGEKISSWDDMVLAITEADSNSKLDITVLRDGKKEEITTSIGKSENGGNVIGITAAREKNIGKSIIEGPKASLEMMRQMYDGLGTLITGQASTKDLVGPVGIVNLVSESINQGLMNFLYLAALISLNLAVINLLPFPALDGGRILFVLIRLVTRNKLSENVETYVHAIGMILLLGLSIYITFNDVIKLLIK